MAFTEFYVTQHGSVSAFNGGSGLGAATYSTANCDSDAGGTHLTDQSGSTWGISAVAEWVCFNNAGTAGISRITNITGNVATIAPALPAGLRGLAGKSANVGGAWDLPSTAATYLSAIGSTLWPAGLDSPRINIARESGAAYSETVDVSFTADWSSAVPLCIEAYNTTAGDIDCWNSTERAIIDFGASGKWYKSSAQQLVTIGLDCRNSASTRVLETTDSYQTFINCRGYTTSNSGSLRVFSATAYTNLLRCSGIRTTSPPYPGDTFTFYLSQPSSAIGCVAVGPDKGGIADWVGFNGANGTTFVNCVSRGHYFGIAIVGAGLNVLNCDFLGNYYGCVGSYLNYPRIVWLNNKVGRCSSFGMTATGASVIKSWTLDFSEFGHNTSGNYDALIESQARHDQLIKDTSKLVRDYAQDDWRSAPTSWGHGTGFPGVLPTGEPSHGHLDIGALQRRQLKRQPTVTMRAPECPR